MSTSITHRLDRELIPLGFTRVKTTWNRETDSLVEVIDIQQSKGKDAVTMNVGVLSRPIFSDCWGHDAPQFVEEPYCTVRARVGQLLDGRDRWWQAKSPETPDELAAQVRTHVLPFLVRMHALEEMRSWLQALGAPSPKRALESINLALIQKGLGDLRGASATLAELERTATGGWKVRAKVLAERIGHGLERT